MRTIDLHHFCPLGSELIDCLVELLEHAGLVALAVKLLHDADAHTLQITIRALASGGNNRGHRLVHAGRIKGIMPGDDLMQQCRVKHCTRSRTTLI